MLGESPRIDATFLQYASDLLAETQQGLSGGDIVRVTSAHAVDCRRSLPHPTYPFQAANKRTALYENLQAFDGPEQVKVLLQLCDHPRHPPATLAQREQLKLRLLRDYAHLAPRTVELDGLGTGIIEETGHWLQGFPESRRLYDDALRKRSVGLLQRNLLDDLRLALELLVKRLLGNDKSLENQLPGLGAFVAARGGSPEIGNLLHKAIDYYTRYQNSYVKHDDAVKPHEVDLAVEWTVMLMRHLLRLQAYAVPVPPAPWPTRS